MSQVIQQRTAAGNADAHLRLLGANEPIPSPVPAM